jgi:hypothetical protein
MLKLFPMHWGAAMMDLGGVLLHFRLVLCSVQFITIHVFPVLYTYSFAHTVTLPSPPRQLPCCPERWAALSPQSCTKCRLPPCHVVYSALIFT